MKDVKKVAARLEKDGGKRIEAVVRSCHVYREDGQENARVALRLNVEVPWMVKGDDDEYTEGTSDTVWLSEFSLAAVLRANRTTASIVRYLTGADGDDEDLESLLSFACVDLILEHVYAGIDDEGNPLVYENPFSDNPVGYEIEHDSIYCHLISVDFSDEGLDIVDGIKDALADARRERILAARKQRQRKAKRNTADARSERPARHHVHLEDATEDDEAEDEVEAPAEEAPAEEAKPKRQRKAATK